MALLKIHPYEFYVSMDDTDIQWQSITVGAIATPMPTVEHTVDCSSGQVWIGAYSAYSSSTMVWTVIARSHQYATNVNEKTHTGTRTIHSYYSDGPPGHEEDVGLLDTGRRINPGSYGTPALATWSYMRRLDPLIHGDENGIATIVTYRTVGTSSNLKIAAFRQRYGGL